MSISSDPGWGPAVRRWGVAAIPLFGRGLIGRAGRQGGLDGLSSLRVVFLAFVSALGLTLLVAVVLAGGTVFDATPSWVLPALIGFGIASLGGVVWAHRTPLDRSSLQTLANSYRSIFFRQVAFAEAAALIGLVLVFIFGALWPFLVGIGFGAIGLALAAPSQAVIRRRQREITSRWIAALANGGASLHTTILRTSVASFGRILGS